MVFNLVKLICGIEKFFECGNMEAFIAYGCLGSYGFDGMIEGLMMIFGGILRVDWKGRSDENTE